MVFSYQVSKAYKALAGAVADEQTLAGAALLSKALPESIADWRLAQVARTLAVAAPEERTKRGVILLASMLIPDETLLSVVGGCGWLASPPNHQSGCSGGVASATDGDNNCHTSELLSDGRWARELARQ